MHLEQAQDRAVAHCFCIGRGQGEGKIVGTQSSSLLNVSVCHLCLFVIVTLVPVWSRDKI
jgi:hypothetical protein